MALPFAHRPPYEPSEFVRPTSSPDAHTQGGDEKSPHRKQNVHYSEYPKQPQIKA
jgi:hypothetical protein